MVEKFSDLKCSDYLKMHLWNSLPPGHDLIISPSHVEQPPIYLPQKSLSPYEKFFFLEKKLLHTLLGEDKMFM